MPAGHYMHVSVLNDHCGYSCFVQLVELLRQHPDRELSSFVSVIRRFPNVPAAIVACVRHVPTGERLIRLMELDLPSMPNPSDRFDAVSRIPGIQVSDVNSHALRL